MVLVNAVSFTAASAGTGTFVFAIARSSFRTPAQAVAQGDLVNGQTVSYHAQDAVQAPTQRAWGRGIYTGGTVTRDPNEEWVTSGGGTGTGPLNFLIAPVVSFDALAQDISSAGGVKSVSPYQFGAIADGAVHALSTRYATLGAAQAAYPFATSLGQAIDYCALQQAFYTAFGFPGSEHNVDTQANLAVHIEAGNYQIGADFIQTKNLRSGLIYGDGKFVSTVSGTGNFVIQTNGCWYTTWRNFGVFQNTGAGITAFDLDGNILHDGSSLGVQGCSFYDMIFVTQGSLYCFYSLRQGQSFGQGDNCQYFNCHFSGASFACYRQDGFNNIHNNFYGGDTQNYTTNGHYHFDGWAGYFSHSFESTAGYTQIANGGYDLFFNGSDGSGCSIYNCRTESPQFLSAVSIPVDVRACHGANGEIFGWGANTSYPLNSIISVANNAYTFPDGVGRVFKATTGGTSGGTQPTWNWQGGTTSDGTVVWTEVPVQWLVTTNGTVDLGTTSTIVGQIIFPYYKADSSQGVLPSNVKTANYTITQYDDLVLVDATSGPITISIPGLTYGGGGLAQSFTRRLVIKKVDTSANAVTIQCVAGSNAAVGADAFEGNVSTDTIVGGSRGWREYIYGQQTGNATPPWWYKIASG
jgi:hypothetical protein